MDVRYVIDFPNVGVTREHMKKAKSSPTVYKTPSQCGWSKVTVERFAQAVAEEFDFQVGADLVPVVRCLGGSIMYLQPSAFDLTDGGSIQIEEDGSFQIFLSSFTHPLRDRFTVAHELGHYFLHAGGKGPFKAERYGSGRTEWEVNWFAAAFLMPEDRVREAARKSLVLSQLAETFRVSSMAMEVRLKSLKLLG